MINNPSDSSAKSSEADFWTWFQSIESDIPIVEGPASLEAPVFVEMGERLKAFAPSLCFVMSANDEDGKREFIISADGLVDSFPAVFALVKAAPEFPNWTITPFRPGRHADFGLKMGPYEVETKDIHFRFAEEESGKVALQVHSKVFVDQDGFRQGLFVIMDSMVGEYFMEMMVGGIDFVPLDEKLLAEKELLPLVQLGEVLHHYLIKLN